MTLEAIESPIVGEVPLNSESILDLKRATVNRNFVVRRNIQQLGNCVSKTATATVPVSGTADSSSVKKWSLGTGTQSMPDDFS